MESWPRWWALVKSTIRACTLFFDLPTFRRATLATACPPERWVMWWVSLSTMKVAGSPSEDRSEAVSTSMRAGEVFTKVAVRPLSNP